MGIRQRATQATKRSTTRSATTRSSNKMLGADNSQAQQRQQQQRRKASHHRHALGQARAAAAGNSAVRRRPGKRPRRGQTPKSPISLRSSLAACRRRLSSAAASLCQLRSLGQALVASKHCLQRRAGRPPPPPPMINVAQISRGGGGTRARLALVAVVAVLLTLHHHQSSQHHHPAASGLHGLHDQAGGERARANEQPLSEHTRRVVNLSGARSELDDKLNLTSQNTAGIIEALFKKRPYSKYWTVEQKWDDLFRRLIAVQGTLKQTMLKNLLRDIEYYADMNLSKQCEDAIKYIQIYTRHSSNFRWLAHMFDSAGKTEPGMLTGNLAHLGHAVQCIRVRAPARPSNDSFNERFFEEQTRQLGERFRGKYCLASIRPVLPPKPQLISRFTQLMDETQLSNISYMGEPVQQIKQRARQLTVPAATVSEVRQAAAAINRLDQVPFESELYGYLIAQRNFMYTLPRFVGNCYPSSCSRDDIRALLQRTYDDQHQVVDIEFECEQEQSSLWEWLITPRLVSYVLLFSLLAIVFVGSMARYILVDKMRIKRDALPPTSRLANVLDALEMISMDKCAGILFIKTKRASPNVDWTKVENNRSTSIDSLRGFLLLVLIYSQLVVLGCLPVPFMWSKWSDALFPFFRSVSTQFFINMPIWTESFYIISAYIIGVKFLENLRPKPAELGGNNAPMPVPNFLSFALKRYVRLATPMVAFIFLNYVWPQLSNGFVMQDQANKIITPCDSLGWTNLLMFHNQRGLNETCLWPSHVSASFFQLHLLSYPILLLCLMCLYSEFNRTSADTNYRSSYNIASSSSNIFNGTTSDSPSGQQVASSKLLIKFMHAASISLMGALALGGAIYPALKASEQELIVPFLIDYIDYDNYERVLEWMVVPTINHLTGYMFGLLLAYLVARNRLKRELKRQRSGPASAEHFKVTQWFQSGQSIARSNESQNVVSKAAYITRVDTPESVCSSSTEGIVVNMPSERPVSDHTSKFAANAASTCSSSAMSDAEHARGARRSCSAAFACAGSFLAALATLVASWFWNGLSQPMTSEQTFWYVLVTKLVFCASFATIFYHCFAQRKNCNNPWMITRFLVPIGRMSLTAFYLSWLVIWFDLLSSNYQWHPSHYFVFEKFTEIICITLILAMLVYGVFEGSIKRAQYAIRRERVERDRKYLLALGASLTFKPSLVATNGSDAVQQATSMPLLVARRKQVKSFESFFEPSEKKMLDAGGQNNGGRDKQEQQERRRQSSGQHDSADYSGKHEKVHTTDGKGGTKPPTGLVADQNQQPAWAGEPTSATATAAASAPAYLSPIDRCKLNAELRANYSFASIGLYESAGATAELKQFRGSQASVDPRSASPALIKAPRPDQQEH